MRILPLALALLLISAGPALAAPTASFTATPNPAERDQAVTFTSDSTPDPAGPPLQTYQWDFQNNGSIDLTTTAPVNTAQHPYPNAGTKSVRLIVTDEAGGTDDVVAEVEIVAPTPANRDPVARFSVDPAAPVAGQEVEFNSDSSDPDGDPLAREWDTDGDGFDDGAGDIATRKYDAGRQTVRLRVTDGRGGTDTETKTVTVAAAPENRLPIAQFSVTPQSPTVGEQVALKSFSVDPDGSIKEQRWDLDGDGDFSENVTGPTAFTTFVTPGTRVVRLKVTDNENGVQTDTVQITVKPAPSPPAAGPTTPGATTPTPPKAKLSALGSLALVRLAGSATMKATRVQILQARAPTKSLVEVRCAGKGCPVQKVRKRIKRKPVRFDVLERSLRAGTVLTVFIRKSGYVGKYTRFLMRPGKPPKRVDGCVMPGKTKRSRCPAA